MEPAQEITPGLLDALSFKVHPNSAKYVTSSRQCSFYAPGDRFSAATSRVIRINVSGSGYLNLATLVLAATATNEDDAGNLVPLTETTANLWSRMTVTVGGAICEDISQYGRVSQLLSMFESASKRSNSRTMGWGAGAIAPQTSREILHVPASGLFSCGKWLPLDFAQGGITISFEMAPVGEAWDSAVGNSTNCVLTNVRMLGTVAVLDSEMHSQYAAYLLNESGKLQIPYRTWTSQLAALPNSSNWSVTVSRSFKKLNTILLSLFRAVEFTGKQCNTFTTPRTPNACEGWVSIGASRWPDAPQRGAAEQFMRLCSAIGCFQSMTHALDISSEQYSAADGGRYCMAFDVEKCAQATETGEDVSSGAICTLFANNVIAADEAEHPTHAHVVCYYDACLTLSDGGAIVHE